VKRRTPRRKEVPDIAEIEIGSTVDGTVERITPYGAFLKLEDGRLGLVHISEIDRNYVKDVHDHLREGDVVQAKVRAIKEDGSPKFNRRIWVGIWVDYGPHGPVGGPLGGQEIGGGVRG